MSILIDTTTRTIVMGATGSEGTFWTGHMIELGTRVIAAVTPGKEGERVGTIPVYHSIRRACDAQGSVDAAMLFVPPKFTKDAVYECLDAGIHLIVTVADGIPLHDTLQIRASARAQGAMVIGGNTSGIISPGKAMLGMFPYWIQRVYTPGTIGVMTRSGSLTNEVTSMVVSAGFGVSTLIGVGGDPVPGTRFSELLPKYEQDPETKAVVMIGELGGSMEEEVAKMLRAGLYTKPLVAFIGGRHAPQGKRMGHAGAIASGSQGGALDKMKTLQNAGALIAERASMVGTILAQKVHP